VEQSYVTSGYFEAMGIPFLQGRLMRSEASNDTNTEVVINRAMADKYWPESNPVGDWIYPNDPHPQWKAQVVGVVENTRQWDAEGEVLPEMYYPQTFRAYHNGYIVMRSSGHPVSLVPLIREQLTLLDRNLPLANIRSMKEVLHGANSARCLSTQLMNIMAGITLVITIVGIYGTLSYYLAQRHKEIGIRIALGALPKNILRYIFSQACVWLSCGLGLGLIGAGLFSLLLRSRVYGISALYPGSFLLGIIVVTCAIIIACLIPVLRTFKIDPMEALRYE
jgi:putative ABC transport system permease protein